VPAVQYRKLWAGGKMHAFCPHSGYPLGLASLAEAQSWVIVRRLFPDTRVTASRLAA